MTTADRIDAELHRAWSRALTSVSVPARPHAGVRTGEYVGKHRRPATRRLSLRALFYFARHHR